jgi:hypothetical protein
MRLDHVSYLAESRYPHLAQRIHLIKPSLPVVQGAQRDFRNNKRVHHDLPNSEQVYHLGVAAA